MKLFEGEGNTEMSEREQMMLRVSQLYNPATKRKIKWKQYS